MATKFQKKKKKKKKKSGSGPPLGHAAQELKAEQPREQGLEIRNMSKFFPD
jgi:hypothetical protein